MGRQKEKRKRSRYLHSGVFKRLFLSYAVMILLAVGAFQTWAVLSYRRETSELARREVEQNAAAWGTWMDQQLMQAQILCASVNASESARSALQTLYVEKTTMNALQLYNMLGDLNRIKGSIRSTCLNNLILAFQGENKVFLPGTVYTVDGTCQLMQSTPYFETTSAAQVLGVSGQQMMLNKEYLIYGEAYTGFGTQSSIKGDVLILIEPDQVRSALKEKMGGSASVRISRRGQTAFEDGETEEYAVSIQSMADNTVVYDLSVPLSALSRPLPVSAMVTFVWIGVFAALLFMLAFRTSLKYYRPIDDIQRLVQPGGFPAVTEQNGQEPSQSTESDEFDRILQGITGLIGERNGYRERMVTITPYARQGMLQAVIRGAGHPEMLVEEQFTELRKNYYTVGEVNLMITRDTAAAERRYRDLQEIILSICKDLGNTEDTQIVAVPENLQNVFVIVSRDEKEGFDEFFYRLYSAIEENTEEQDTVITIGVGRRESDLDRLSTACREAQASLGQMLTGGRGAVYFPEERTDAAPGYFFPRDAQKQMVRLLKDRNLDGLNALLDEIYQKNLVEADLPAGEIRLMADELYWTIRKALRNAYDLSTTHVRMEPIREAATIDEIFAYYRQVFQTGIEEATLPDDTEQETDLEDEICTYLEKHLYDPELSLSAIADRFGVSTKMVGLICRKRYGKTYLNYVRDCQIQHATELLKETELSLEEIAGQCGFANVLTFRRNFKAVTGVNPSEYRG